MPLVDPVRRVVLFTNAKCGGTTLKAWFFENVGFADLHRHPARLFRDFGPRFAVRYLRRGRRFAASAHRTADDSEAYKLALRHFIYFYRLSFCLRFMRSGRAADFHQVCVVRDPYDRVVSAFLDKFCTDGRFGRHAPYVQRMLGELGRTDMTFREFLRYLRQLDEQVCPAQWRRQTYVLDGQRVDSYVRLEALHDEMAQQADLVGADHLSTLRLKLQSTRLRPGAGAAAEDLTDASSLDILAQRAASGSFPPRASFLNRETRERIRELYAEDFERLPYPP